MIEKLADMNENTYFDTTFQDMIRYYKDKDEHQKHLKGYIYDSLVYRYQLARYTQADLEAQNSHASIEEERKYAKRDIMRFVQILDEAMGEHD